MGETKPDVVVVVTSDDEPVGEVVRSEIAAHPGVHFRTAHLFVFDGDGRLLLQQLAAGRDRNPLRWGSSVAAYVRPGETYREAVSRRAHEELGLTVRPDFVGKTEMPDLGGTKHIALFATGIGRHELVIREPDHVAEVDWVQIETLRRAIETEPSRFTETFLWLFKRFYIDGERRRIFGA